MTAVSAGQTLLPQQLTCTFLAKASQVHSPSSSSRQTPSITSAGKPWALVKPALKLLMAMLTFDLRPSEGVNRFVLTTLPPEGVVPMKMLQSGTRIPVREERRLPVVQIMHTGRLVSVSVTKAQDLAAS